MEVVNLVIDIRTLLAYSFFGCGISRFWLRRVFFFFQAEDGIRYLIVTGFQTCALPISLVLIRMAAHFNVVDWQQSAELLMNSLQHFAAARSRREVLERIHEKLRALLPIDRKSVV